LLLPFPSYGGAGSYGTPLGERRTRGQEEQGKGFFLRRTENGRSARGRRTLLFSPPLPLLLCSKGKRMGGFPFLSSPMQEEEAAPINQKRCM